MHGAVDAAVVLNGDLQAHIGAFDVALLSEQLQRWHGDRHARGVDCGVGDAAHHRRGLLHRDVDANLVLNVGSDRHIALVLGAVARVDENALEVVAAVRVLQRRVVDEDRLVAVLQSLDLAFADEIHQIGVLR